MLVFYEAAAIVILAGSNQLKQVIGTESSLTVHVVKAGLISAAAHEHGVDAPIAGFRSGPTRSH